MEISENQKKQAMQNARKSRHGKMKGEYLRAASHSYFIPVCLVLGKSAMVEFLNLLKNCLGFTWSSNYSQ